MPRRIFPAGSVTNTSGLPLRLTFHYTQTGSARSGDLWTLDGSNYPATAIPNGVIITDASGNYSAFAGPDDVDFLWVQPHTGDSRTQATATATVANGTTVDGGTYAAKANATNPNDVGYDVIVLLGQSNMVGFAPASVGTNAPDLTYLDPVNSRIWRWVNSANTLAALGSYKSMISLAFDPLGHGSTANSTVGPGMPFAREYVRSVPTNRNVLLVPCAVGGTPLVTTTPPTWNSTVSGSLFSSAVSTANAAVTAAGANARVVAFLWVQGESDAVASVTGGNYQAAFDAMIAAFRAQVNTATASTPFVLGSMVPSWSLAPNGTSVSIAAVHAQTPGRVVYTGYAAGPTGSGDIHYAASEQRTLGTAMFAAYRAAVTNILTPAVPDQVAGLTVTSTGNAQIGLTWLTPASVGSAVSDYMIEYKATAESVWSTFADGTSATTTAAVTGLTNDTPYDVRVSAINATGRGSVSATVSATPTLVFTPNSVAGLLSWFRADTITGVADGASLTAWTDSKSGIGLVTAGNSPTYRAAAVNAKPGVQFVAASTQGLGNNSATLSIGNSYTSFIVCSVNTSTVAEQQFLAYYGNNTGAFQHSWTAGFTSGQVSWFDGTLRDIGVWTNGAWAIWEVVNNDTGNASDKLKNGTSVGTGTAFSQKSNAAQLVYLGRAATGASYADMTLSELLIYNAALTSTDRSAVRAYLGTKYGITIS